MRLPPYPKYKASGVEWLGDVPEYWEVKRLDFLATVKARLGWKGLTADEYVPEGYIFLATPNIKGEGEIDFQNASYITAERYFESPEIMLREGDVLMAKDGSTLGIVNVVHHLPAPATVNGSIAVLRPKGKVESSFLFRWLSGAYVQNVVQSMKDGQGVPHLFQADIRKFSVLVPSPCEQRAIVDFLDTQTAKLDTLVAKRQELIEKLKEKRSALISGTVTRGLPPEAARAAGLNPYPKLKPSGVEWLGEVPKHWSFAQLRRYTSFITSGSRGWAEHYADAGSIFVRIGNLTRDSINVDLSDVQYVDPPPGAEGERTRICAGDLLFSITAYLGSVAVATDKVIGGYINQHIALVRLTGKILIPRFVAYATLADLGQQQLSGQAYGGTKVQLALDDVKSLWLPIPPVPEQHAIADYLDRETNKIDRMVAKVEEAIERLQEYLTVLITAAVTGKIDVREYRNKTEPM